MRQLFKRTRVLLPLLVLLVAPGTSYGQFGRAWEENFDTIPGHLTPDGNPGWWNSFGPMDAGVLAGWKSDAAGTSKWHSNEECQNAMYYTLDALEYADIQQGIGTFAGEYFGPSKKGGSVNDADVIVVHGWALFGPAGFETLIHEAWHRATGATDNDISELNTRLKNDSTIGRPIEECYDEDRKEEEEDDEPGDGGETPKTVTCTETQEWVPPVTIEVFVKPESSTLEGGEPVPTKHKAVPIPGITVSADSKGQWVDVVIEEGYWKTVKECTES